MNKKLEQLIEDNSSKFNEWIESINTHNNSMHSKEKYSNDELTDIILKTANTLGSISDLFFKYGSFKDKFENGHFHPNFHGPSLIIKSIKTETSYNFGIDEKGIYLNTYLMHSDNLRYMDDSFWLELLQLSKIGEFELVENEHFGQETKNKYPQELFNNQKGNIYRIFRKYFISSIERHNDIVLGDLQIRWKYSDDFYDIISNGCIAFKALYNLNYQLWKVHDLKFKKKK